MNTRRKWRRKSQLSYYLLKLGRRQFWDVCPILP